LKLLLDANAQPEPPDGVRVRHTPLVLAAMSGDLDNVTLLISRGARATESALGEAVTFGYPVIVKTLIAAGADAGLVESSGINLLHWAAITDRASVIPVLVAAKVPINAMDDHGYTPLMYAASIDFGDTDVLTALLKAGADKASRNFEGRTPLALARQYKHSSLEAALR
jgi:ankyrin repeat protein